MSRSGNWPPPAERVVYYAARAARHGLKSSKKALEPGGSRAVIPTILLAALPCGDAETASGGTRQHQNASPEASFRYSHSFTFVCRCAIPIGSSLVVGFIHLAAESLRVSSRRRLGQTLGQIRKLFRNRKLAVSFLSRGQKRQGFEVRNRSKGMPKRLLSLFGTCLAK